MLKSDLIIVNDTRALAALDVSDHRNGGGFLLVYRDGLDTLHGRDFQTWGWKVLNHDGFTIGSGNDLTGPHLSFTSSYEVVKAVITLIGFLEACAEAGDEDSDNFSLFNEPVREWAEQHSDELTMLGMELSNLIGIER